MLQDRPYMRGSYDRQRTNVLTWLLSAIVAVFFVQIASRLAYGSDFWFANEFGLTPAALAEGHVWTLVTYPFLHSTENLLQIFGYLVALYFVGGEVLSILGGRRFIAFYFSASAVGAVFWAGLHWRHPDLLIGSSAAVYALVVLYACFFPNREISEFFFFLPIRIKPKHLAYLLAAWDLAGCVFYEILGAASPFGGGFKPAHSAHLGGMAAAWIYFRYFHNSGWSFASNRADVEYPRWLKQRGHAKPAAAPAYTVNIGDRGHLRAEVDRILDKINSDGFSSLSAEEKRILDEARDLISRR